MFAHLELMLILGVLVMSGCYDWTIPAIDDAGGEACQCTEGPCCDGCHFMGTETRCDDAVVSAEEYRCATDSCGADVLQRGIFRHCSGVSAECATDMLREGDWEVFRDCSPDQVCVFMDGAALCHTCTEGCDGRHCAELQCESGPCCDDVHFATSSTRCRETAEASECRCTSGDCGADVECRSQYRFCTGISAKCTTDHLEWDDWASSEACSPDQVCEVNSGGGDCADCEWGCELGECRDRECTSGPCCDGAFFRSSSHVCSTETEYRCDVTGCGADIQSRDIVQRCSGLNAVCDGPVEQGPWSLAEVCTAAQTCQITDRGAMCSSCDLGDPSWIERTPLTSPRARQSVDMAYDSERGVTVLFGGCYEADDWECIKLNDTWEWDGTTWTEVSPAVSPSPRKGHALAYDSNRGVTVLFGGSDSGYLDDTWEWNGTVWTNVTPAHSPDARRNHAMVFDDDLGVVRLFGGIASSGSSFSMFTKVWEWDGTSWTDIINTGPPMDDVYEWPLTAISHGMAYDRDRGVTVFLGGSDVMGGSHWGTWEWDGTAWSPVSDFGPTHYSIGMVYDSFQSVAVAFGTEHHETWEWDGSVWTERLMSTNPPDRSFMAMSFDSGRELAVLFGGTHGLTSLGDTWEYGIH